MPQSWQPRSSSPLQPRFRSTSDRRHHPCASRPADQCPAPDTPGLRDIGLPMAAIIAGLRDAGTIRLTKEPTGIIRTMITTSKAGSSTKDTGTTKTTTTAAATATTTTTKATTTNPNTTISGTDQTVGPPLFRAFCERVAD